jgi:hypothetical protein
VRKLPSKEIWLNGDTTFFEYDQWNRLIRIVKPYYSSRLEIRISYDLNHNPIEIGYSFFGRNHLRQTFRYSGNQVFISGPEYATWGSGMGNMYLGTFDTLTMNADGRITEWRSERVNHGGGGSGSGWFLGSIHRTEANFFWNSDGYLTRLLRSVSCAAMPAEKK